MGNAREATAGRAERREKESNLVLFGQSPERRGTVEITGSLSLPAAQPTNGTQGTQAPATNL